MPLFSRRKTLKIELFPRKIPEKIWCAPRVQNWPNLGKLGKTQNYKKCKIFSKIFIFFGFLHLLPGGPKNFGKKYFVKFSKNVEISGVRTGGHFGPFLGPFFRKKTSKIELFPRKTPQIFRRAKKVQNWPKLAKICPSKNFENFAIFVKVLLKRIQRPRFFGNLQKKIFVHKISENLRNLQKSAKLRNFKISKMRWFNRFHPKKRVFFGGKFGVFFRPKIVKNHHFLHKFAKKLHFLNLLNHLTF